MTSLLQPIPQHDAPYVPNSPTGPAYNPIKDARIKRFSIQLSPTKPTKLAKIQERETAKLAKIQERENAKQAKIKERENAKVAKIQERENDKQAKRERKARIIALKKQAIKQARVTARIFTRYNLMENRRHRRLGREIERQQERERIQRIIEIERQQIQEREINILPSRMRELERQRRDIQERPSMPVDIVHREIAKDRQNARKTQNQLVCAERAFGEDTCPICFDDIGKTNFMVLRCGHQTCSDCIIQNIQRVRGMNCPVCREQIGVRVKGWLPALEGYDVVEVID
jgi:DNA repair exonuclease SbcCD ATPase subunit